MTTKFIFDYDHEISVALQAAGQPESLAVMPAIRALADVHLDGKVVFMVSCDLLPPSYSTNPSQLAKYLTSERPAIAQRRDGVMRIVISNEKEPTTFIRKVERKLNLTGFAEFRFDQIPASYKRDPRLVSRILADKFAVCATTNSDSIKWYITVDKTL